MGNETMMDLKTAAARLGLSVSALRRMMLRREIAFYRVGKRILFNGSELDAFLAAHRVGPEEKAA